MSKKTYTLCIREAIATVREFTFEKSFDHDNDATAYLQEIVASGVVPDEVQEEAYIELCDESETYPPAINGNRDQFPGMTAGIVDEKMGYLQRAAADTRYQQAFTWRIADGELHTWPLGMLEGAISGNVLIAQPCNGEPNDYDLTTWGLTTGVRFSRPKGAGTEQTWEVVFVFKQPETE